jgi:hypothetical protein
MSETQHISTPLICHFEHPPPQYRTKVARLSILMEWEQDAPYFSTKSSGFQPKPDFLSCTETPTPFRKSSRTNLPEIFTKITQNTLRLFGNLPGNDDGCEQ